MTLCASYCHVRLTQVTGPYKAKSTDAPSWQPPAAVLSFRIGSQLPLPPPAEPRRQLLLGPRVARRSDDGVDPGALASLSDSTFRLKLHTVDHQKVVGG
jgi:hypothetical protein